MTLSHLSSENVEKCPQCNAANGLKKTMTPFQTVGKKTARPQKVGQITEEFIESSRQDLKRQRKELEKKR
jgi:hypothetical protein